MSDTFRIFDENDQKKVDEAKEKRKRTRDKSFKYTADDLVQDILRVAKDPDNPFPDTCSRKRYRKYGWFGESVVFRTFGNHAEFQRAAELRDSRTTTQTKNRRARLHTEEQIEEYARVELLPFHGKFKKKKDRRGHKLILVGSDWHGEYVDRFTADVFFDVAKTTQPDVIVLNGDVVDFPSVSRWSKNPDKINNLQREIDFTRRHILARARKAAPDAQIDWVIGNHEYRLVRHLADFAPALCSLRCLRFSQLFDLEKLKISLVFGNCFLAPNEHAAKTNLQRNWSEYWDTYVATHGVATGKFPAEKELSRYGMSGTSGHVHRPQMHSSPTLVNQYADWCTAGMMASHRAGEDYMQGPTTWTNGFVFATVFPEDRVAIQQPVIIKKGIATFAGKVYREKK